MKLAVVVTGSNTNIIIARMLTALPRIEQGKVISLEAHEYQVSQRPIAGTQSGVQNEV